VSVKHQKVSAKSDDPDTTLVLPSDWNAAHAHEAEAANLVLAGPVSGGSAIPDFRGLVDADIPAAIARDAEVAAQYVALTDGDWIDLTDGGPTALHGHTGGGGTFTNRVWFNKEELHGIGATSTQVGTNPNQQATWRFPAAATGAVQFDWVVPPDWSSGAVDLILHYCKAAVGTGDIYHRVNYSELAAGDDAGETGTNSDQTVAVAADPAQTHQVITWPALFTPGAIGQVWRFNYIRLGGDAADTYADNSHVLGVELRYTATGYGGIIVPTGTGFTHITGGAQDAAAKTVDLASADVTGVLPGAKIDSTIARDTEVAAEIATHAAAPDPHTVYGALAQAEIWGALQTFSVGIATGGLTLTQGASDPLVIDGAGAIVVTNAYHKVEVAVPPLLDNLDTVTGLGVGEICFIQPNSDANTINIRHDIGNISCVGQANILMDDIEDFVILIGTAGNVLAMSSHGRSHNHSDTSDGNALAPITITPGTLVLPNEASPAPTIEAAIVWDTNDDKIVVGDGVGTKHIVPTAAYSGDATVSEAGVLTIGADKVTYAKMQNVSATDKVLGRATGGPGDVEEIACTAAGRALIDDADAAAQRATLGLGAIALEASPLQISKGGTGVTAQQFSVVQYVFLPDAAIDADVVAGAQKQLLVSPGSDEALARIVVHAGSAGGTALTITLEQYQSGGAGVEDTDSAGTWTTIKAITVTASNKTVVDAAPAATIKSRGALRITIGGTVTGWKNVQAIYEAKRPLTT